MRKRWLFLLALTLSLTIIISSWAVNRETKDIVFEASAEKTAGTTFSSAYFVGQYYEGIIILDITAADTATVDVNVQTSIDGSKWADVPSGAVAQQTATGTTAIKLSNFGSSVRIKNVVTGTATYSIRGLFKN